MFQFNSMRVYVSHGSVESVFTPTIIELIMDLKSDRLDYQRTSV